MNPLPTILTLHPDPLIRAGIVSSLRGQAGFAVFDDDSDGASFDGPPVDVVVAEYHQAMRLAEAAVGTRRACLANASVLVLTSNDRAADVRRAMEAGMHGYLLLGGPVCELIDAVATLAGGGRYVGRAVAQRMMDSFNRSSLTSRECEVLQLVVAGESNKMIARRLQIEVGTVKSHMNAILGKLGASSRTQAAAVAVRRGLVDERARAPFAPFAPFPLQAPQAGFSAQT